MFSSAKLFLIILFVSLVYCERGGHTISFDRGYYTLWWGIEDGQIEIEFIGRTRGWVGFGLNTKNKMNQAELLIAGVDDETGKPYFRTFLGKGHKVKEFSNEVWILDHAEQNATHTVIRAERPLQPDEEDFLLAQDEERDSCPADTEDKIAVSRPRNKDIFGDRFPPFIPIKDKKLYVLWACGKTDHIKEHHRYGSDHVNFIHPFPAAIDEWGRPTVVKEWELPNFLEAIKEREQSKEVKERELPKFPKKMGERAKLEPVWTEFEFKGMRKVKNGDIKKVMYPHLFK